MSTDTPSSPTHPDGETPSATGAAHEARAGDRGAASGRNIAQNRAIGQDDPMDGSRMGREQHKAHGFPGDGEADPDSGTDAAQTREAQAKDKPPTRR